MGINLAIKKNCIEMSKQGKTSKEIYNEYFKNVHSGQTYKSFRTSLQRWKKRPYADDLTLNRGTYEGFVPHNATVQVDGAGNVVQAWIKQQTEENIEDILQKITEIPKVEYIEPIKSEAKAGMLEIPLYDVHFGINDIKYYQNNINNILMLIKSKHWECIQFIVGQDLFHNDDFRGRTTKGTSIQAVDIESAFIDARTMYFSLIRKALQYTDNVEVHYSEGNHDETIGWFFFQVLKQAFDGQAMFDDLREPRKCIHWHNIFIGYGHCDDGRTTPKDIRCQFTIEFPMQFANSTSREIHLGHLHTEMKDGDVDGIVVRRLSTANKTDSWHKKNGYVGNHKRFQVFEYTHNELKAIHYV